MRYNGVKAGDPIPTAIEPYFGPEFQMMAEKQPEVPEDELEAFRAYVAGVDWRFAKTYAKNWPHEYTIRWWREDLDEVFCKLAPFVEKYGVRERFYKLTRAYFYLDGYKYWVMGNEETLYVLNRAEGTPNPFRLPKE